MHVRSFVLIMCHINYVKSSNSVMAAELAFLVSASALPGGTEHAVMKMPNQFFHAQYQRTNASDTNLMALLAFH